MKGKLLFVVGLGVGYVLGTRAGRERYEQIARAAERVWNQPAVQQGVDSVKDFASSKLGDVSETVLDNVKQFIGTQASKNQAQAKRDVRRTAGAAKRAVDEAADALDDAIDTAASAARKASSTRPSSSKSNGSSSTGSAQSAASDS